MALPRNHAETDGRFGNNDNNNDDDDDDHIAKYKHSNQEPKTVPHAILSALSSPRGCGVW